MRTHTAWLCLATASVLWPAAPVRQRRALDENWRFHLGDVTGAEQAAFEDRAWRRVEAPHDWSIEGPYSAGNASGTGYLPGGIGWYRKTFDLEEALRGHKVFVEFDGVYRDCEAWINGHRLGRRPSGYASFQYDLTPYVKFGATNLLAVRVDHTVVADSRWYTGSGIYRHVWLTVTEPVHAAHWGTYIRTPLIRSGEALVSVETAVVNESKAEAAVRVVTTIEDAGGRSLASESGEQRVAAGATQAIPLQARVEKPELWSLRRPYLYAAVTRVYAGGVLSDEVRTPFGIRALRFDPNGGFFLNGEPMKLKGVCIHHDLGALGAASSGAALERRLKALKDLGVNAIRGAHNPMAPEFYALCDRLGLLVMDEAFDEWSGGKRKWAQGWNVGTAGTRGYHEVFEEWSTRDLEDLVLRDRNHPSVAMWSIGNEIDYPGDPFTHPFGRDGFRPGTPSANVLAQTGRRLLGIVKGLDPTRPVTMGLADIRTSNAIGLAGMLDVVGYNYQEQSYKADHEAWPERVILGSENARSLAAWRVVAENAYVAGQFLWTGADFLGESGRYPHRGSQSGLLDFCGFRKPEAYLRQALWSDQPMVYAVAVEGGAGGAVEGSPTARGRRVAEHWNWSGDGRKAVPVEVYTNCDAAELWLNGKSLGEKTVADRVAPVLRWEVPNEPGVVRAVGKRDGVEAARFELATAGEPARVDLAADKTRLEAGGRDLANIEVRVVDGQGRRVPRADQWIEFTVSGAGALLAVDNADPRDISPVQASRRKVYNGRALAIIGAGRQAGKISLRASAPGLQAGEVTVTVAGVSAN